MTVTDLKKEYKPYYSASAKKPVLVDVPALQFLTYDGEGHPENNVEFHGGFEVLYSLAYTLKFAFKLGPSKQDFKVMPPEALMWIDGDRDFESASREEWRWRLMVAVPDCVDGAALKEARATIKKKKGLTSVDRVRLRKFREGKAVQFLHVGPYDQEHESIRRMEEFAAESGCRASGKHHEIYLSDPRRASPEKLKTILRMPVKKAQLKP